MNELLITNFQETCVKQWDRLSWCIISSSLNGLDSEIFTNFWLHHIWLSLLHQKFWRWLLETLRVVVLICNVHYADTIVKSHVTGDEWALVQRYLRLCFRSFRLLRELSLTQVPYAYWGFCRFLWVCISNLFYAFALGRLTLGASCHNARLFAGLLACRQCLFWGDS